jgi:hypothetical protein
MNNPYKSQLPTQATIPAPRRGRPRKFSVPSRAVTLTLPETVIAALERVDRDLSRAVVRVTQPEIRKRPHAAAELTSFGSRAVIVVNPTRTLERFIGVMLVPLSDGRALISFDESTTPARLELMLEDALEAHTLPPRDAEILGSIRELLQKARRSTSVRLSQRNIMVLEHVRRKADNGKRLSSKATRRLKEKTW